MSTPIDSTFTSEGVALVGESRDMAYLYGLSDFFTFLFEDQDKLGAVLESAAYSSSDIYSSFLQQTSSISIESVQTYLGVSIKLLLIEPGYEVVDPTDLNLVAGTKFKLPYPLANAKYLANRPFLPTESLEVNADFTIEQIDSSSCYVTFAKPLVEYKFSQRKSADSVFQTAVWATDVSLDAQYVSKNFVPLLGASAENSTDRFTDFVYGLYYLYWNGPTTSLMESGLNLALGIPLARATEEVLDIRTYYDTGQYLVITGQYQYLLPENAIPVTNIGETLFQGRPLALAVEVKDYTKDGEWWVDVSIPEYIVGRKPSSQSDRFARTGTAYYYLMKDCLKNHCFLVRINNGSLSGETSILTMFEVLNRVKPSYTQPLFITKIDLSSDIVPPVIDDTFEVSQRNTALKGINFEAINDGYIN